MSADVVRVVLVPGQRLEVSYAAPLVDRGEPEMMLTLDAVAVRFATTVRVLRRLIASGKLPATRTGRAYSIRVEDAARLFAPTLRKVQSRTSRPANDESDKALAGLLRERGVRVGGGR